MNSLTFKLKTEKAVTSYEEASAIVQAYLFVKNLGSSRYKPVILYSNGVAIAHISYNGRVWVGTDYFSNDRTEIQLNKDAVNSLYTHYKTKKL